MACTRRNLFAIFLPILLLTAGPALALQSPTGEQVLLLVGEGLEANSPEGAAFDMAMLEALPQAEIVTTTPWIDGVQRYTGPLLSSVLDAVGATHSTLRLVALDGYVMDVPWEDLETFAPILCTRIGGSRFTVREKGPLWLIYPLDGIDEELRQIYLDRSVWQLTRIEVLDN